MEKETSVLKKDFVGDYEEEWRKQQLHDTQAKKLEALKEKFLREKLVSDLAERERQLKEEERLQKEATDIMVQQLEYLRLRRAEEEKERAWLAEESRRRRAEDEQLAKEAEQRAEFTRKLQKEAFMIRCSKAITKPYVFSYYKERGSSARRPATTAGATRNNR